MERWHVSAAQSVLEAVLVSGGKGDSLIVVDVADEIDHLEAGMRSLRQVNPACRIVLLCEPALEGFCRRALAWGADDYFLLPLDARSRALLMGANGKPRAAHRDTVMEQPRPQPARALQDGPAMPLGMQTEMLEEILEGAGLHGDFAQRATASIKRSLAIKGELRFVGGEEAGDADGSTAHSAGEFRRSVLFAGQAPFGALVWRPDDGTAAAEAGVLAQAARWLAAMLALSQRYEQLRLMAITDELSGAYNRRYFVKYMTGLLERARENRFRVTVLLFDIDDFKKYNDQFGHASGDAIIRELIRLLRACTRPHDLVARIGGDEFAVVYWDNEAPRQPNSEHPKEILAATERFRDAIRNHQWPQTCNIKGEISISGGLATFPWDADNLETLMARADEALLRAKAGGKNVILLHGAEQNPAI
jgi:diguanylate cyclase (GGDEF)-like protein